MNLSVIVPVYNECANIERVLKRIETSGLGEYELIVVDDGSTDGSTEILRQHLSSKAILLAKPKNEGKTSAVRDALQLARGRWVIVHDADLEYDPTDIRAILQLASDAGCAIYGRRPSYWSCPDRVFFAAGVLLVDIAIYLIYGRWVRDHATCYKLVSRQVLCKLALESTGFEGCVEITAKLIRTGVRIVHVPISYNPRTPTDGKKLTTLYGVKAMWTVWKYRKWKPTESHCS